MLFNTYVFIFAFWPITAAGYFLLNRFRYTFAAKCWLTLSSLFFYGWWNVGYLPLILGSIAFNYAFGRLLQAKSETAARYRKTFLIAAIGGNLLLLAYYKYADFFLGNLSSWTGHAFPVLHLLLPLGISFFTFTQIAYLVDAYKGKASEYNIVSYMLFVTFYPHLIAGPILHHSEMMPQFDRLRNKVWQWGNVSKGVYIFCIGLFKKVVIADTFATAANDGFASATHFFASWTASLSYTFQLYYDFSGYTDMAIGAALIFNIKLPQNFNSPYKALSIQDFWRRWHMTLSRFLRDYIYIPLGGNRRGEAVMLRNLVITFLLGGLWHGAGWTFLFWGLLHGVGQVVHRFWGKLGRPLPRWLAWFVTFMFINVTWVFFRADSWGQAARILKGMAGLQGVSLVDLKTLAPTILLLALFLPIVLAFSNSSQLNDAFRPTWRSAVAVAALFVFSLLYFNRISEFLYFNF
ncbi:MBOAT family O-acyltransferase [Paenibacillus glycinis]|uniref:MBOAT family protein n=1 Tax=Paenibacillus glycinis TaxID=2697035 RepID=A0ABW9XMH1_9BACL|nr:MBOAT family O-acyltransferase [Paenibacillus glycinis]NBD23821.1 MBOAT family protein [Paenibacillus glycinis]